MNLGTSYIIKSKLTGELLFKGRSFDIDNDIKRHKFYLSKSIHPVPQLMTHLTKYGILDFDFIIENAHETAVLTPSKQKRMRKVE